MSGQTDVPTSTTGWCSSGLSLPPRASLPWAKISATWERSSRDSGSMTWNSSSMPIVRLGRSIPGSARLQALTGAPCIFSGQVPASSTGRGLFARSTSMSATVLSTQSKFACPTENRSQSGAGFMKSIA